MIRIQHGGCYWCELNTPVWSTAFQKGTRWLDHILEYDSNANSASACTQSIISSNQMSNRVISLSCGFRETLGFQPSIQELPDNLCHRIISYLLFEFVGFCHTPPRSSPAESCWSGSPETRHTHCSYLPPLLFFFYPHQHKLASHVKAGSSLRLLAGCFYPGRAPKNKLLFTATSVGVVTELHFWKPKLEGRRHERLGCLLKVGFFFSFRNSVFKYRSVNPDGLVLKISLRKKRQMIEVIW